MLPILRSRVPLLSIILLAAAFLGLAHSRAGEASNTTRIEELERRPIPGTDLEIRLSLFTQPPGYSAPLHHHPGEGFVYMLEGTAESAYGDEAVKRFRAGDHWFEPADVPHRVAGNPDPQSVRRFLVFSVNRPGEPGTVIP